MDVVICVSSKDCLIVKKTVFYIHRNIESDNIYLITDKHSFGFFSKRFRSRYNISLIDEEEIVADRRQLEAIAGRVVAKKPLGLLVSFGLPICTQCAYIVHPAKLKRCMLPYSPIQMLDTHSRGIALQYFIIYVQHGMT